MSQLLVNENTGFDFGDNFNQEVNGKPLTPDELLLLNRINEEYAHTTIGSKNMVISRRKNGIKHVTHHFEPIQEFKNRFLHQPKIAKMNMGEAWLCWPNKRYFSDGIAFYPNVNECPETQYNMFTGFALKPIEGDVSPFIKHVEDVICAGDKIAAKYTLAFFAHLVQKPEEKPSVAIVMKSVEGTGKGSLMQPILNILGDYASQTNGAYLVTGRFNSALANNLLIFADEVDLTDKRTADKLKALISESTMQLERKGIDPVVMGNYLRFVFATNMPTVLKAGSRERRYLVLQPCSLKAQDKDYFNDYYDWLNSDGANHLLHYLSTLDISDFDPRRAPVTQALQDEKMANLSPAEDFMYSELLKDKPFEGISVRPEPKDILNRFDTYLMNKNIQPMSESQKRSTIGILFKNYGIQNHGKRGRNLHYVMPDIDELRRRFANNYGQSKDDLF
jgi:putative DNA primase/helicase